MVKCRYEIFNYPFWLRCCFSSTFPQLTFHLFFFFFFQAPCLYGGVCVNNKGGYNCTCVSNKTGHNCELMADVCKPSPCGEDLCIPTEFETKGYHCTTKDQLIVMVSNEIGKGKSRFQLEKEIEELIKRARQPGTVRLQSCCITY